MTIKAADYSFAHPAPSLLKAAGVVVVVRYTTGDKEVTSQEAHDLRSLDIGLALVHETSIDRPNVSGFNGGAEDARQAVTFSGTLGGYPDGAVIFYADDTSPSLDACVTYFKGVRSVHGTRPIGWYGGYHVGMALKEMGLVDVVWVANAASWSGFHHWSEMAPVVRADPHVSMLQSLDHPLAGIAPSSYDFDELLHPFPAWGLSVVPTPAPPAPKPIPPVVRLKGVSVANLSTVDITIPTTVKGKPGEGNGWSDVPGVAPEKVIAVGVVGLHDPASPPSGYVPIPRVALDTNPKTARVVLEGGVPGGKYVVRVAHV